jgi:hypothetical protein
MSYVWNLLTIEQKDLLEKLIAAQLVKKIPAFMEPDGSLPFSEEPATGPYSKPEES